MTKQAELLNSIKIRMPMEDQLFIDHVLLLVLLADVDRLTDADARRVEELFTKWVLE
jgi:hypothetical protein